MLKEMIVAISFLATLLATLPAMAGDNTQKTLSDSTMAPISEKTSMLDMSADKTLQLI